MTVKRSFSLIYKIVSSFPNSCFIQPCLGFSS